MYIFYPNNSEQVLTVTLFSGLWLYVPVASGVWFRAANTHASGPGKGLDHTTGRTYICDQRRGGITQATQTILNTN